MGFSSILIAFLFPRAPKTLTAKTCHGWSDSPLPLTNLHFPAFLGRACLSGEKAKTGWDWRKLMGNQTTTAVGAGKGEIVCTDVAFGLVIGVIGCFDGRLRELHQKITGEGGRVAEC